MALCCLNLSQLNLKGIHYKASKEGPNNYMEIISKFTNLVSLSLCNCLLGSTSKRKYSQQRAEENMLKRNKRVCHGKNSPGSQSHVDSVAKSDSSPVNDLQAQELSSVGTFDCLARMCSKITEFELIRLSRGINFVKSYDDRDVHINR